MALGKRAWRWRKRAWRGAIVKVARGNTSLTITDDLDWGQHISEITCKATKTLGFLRRNLALAPRHTKEVAYKTLVRPQLEYAAPIWHPYHETQIEMVEKVQRTAAGDGGTPVASVKC